VNETVGEVVNEAGADAVNQTGDEATLGSCLCGDVSYSVNGALRDVLQCHCMRCQKTSGNFMAAAGALASDVVFTSDNSLSWFRPHDDPNVAYGFCNRCGSSLFWKVIDQEAGEPYISICAGTLDSPRGLKTTAIWFADHAAEHTPLDPSIDQIPAADLQIRNRKR
jgi:hypothetical protein